LAFLALLFLFSVAAVLFSQAATVKADANIIRVPNDFPTIQDAINAAQNGSTILVESGIYHEHLTLNKSLTLLGADKEDTIVDGSDADTVINVTASDIILDGFTIMNSSTESAGILLYHSTDSVVTDNVVTLNGRAGIELDGSSNNTVSDNVVSSTGSSTGGGGLAWGVGIELSLSANNTICNNVMTDSIEAGLSLDSSYNNSIFGNTIEYNTPGVELYFSSNNTFFGNNLISNSWQVTLIPIPDSNTWAKNGRGNYWDDYVGLDDGSNGRVAGDGIGDTNLPWHGVDYYPLISPVNPLQVFWGNMVFPVSVVSNSTVSSFNFDQADREVTFNLNGPANTTGCFNVSAPTALLSGPWRVLLDGTDVTPEAVISENQTYTSIYLNYSHSTHTVQIIGTTVIPEYPTATELPLLTLAPLLLVTVLAAKKRKKNRQTPTRKLQITLFPSKQLKTKL
jgi:parallel beta-helix repeat protein